MEITDHAVLDSIERDLLRPEIVERAIELAIDELRPTVTQRISGVRRSSRRFAGSTRS